MPKNEDGEFELILANRQLLSVFFIVVILLGVFFTMGYIVGRNSGPAPVDDVIRSLNAVYLQLNGMGQPGQELVGKSGDREELAASRLASG